PPQVPTTPVRAQPQPTAKPQVQPQPSQPVRVPAQPRSDDLPPTGVAKSYDPELGVYDWDEEELEKRRLWSPQVRREAGRQEPKKDGEQQLTLPGFDDEPVSYGATYDKVKGLFIAHQNNH